MNHLTQTGHTTFHRCFRALVLLTLASTAFGDPCGMVTPVHITGQGQLQRIGLQKTYVFFRDGVETFVIRPGFKGSVEEFGMLIPFPSPPALRKVPDDTFAHIAAAVDPPEVVVDLTPRVFNKTTSDVEDGEVALPESSMSLSNSVTVIKQEAVGMYEDISLPADLRALAASVVAESYAEENDNIPAEACGWIDRAIALDSDNDSFRQYRNLFLSCGP